MDTLEAQLKKILDMIPIPIGILLIVTQATEKLPNVTEFLFWLILIIFFGNWLSRNIKDVRIPEATTEPEWTNSSEVQAKTQEATAVFQPMNPTGLLTCRLTLEVIAAAILLFLGFWRILSIVPPVANEFEALITKNPIVTCMGSDKQNATKIVIADFHKTLDSNIFIEDRLEDNLSSSNDVADVDPQPNNADFLHQHNIRVCRAKQIVSLRSEAQRLGQNLKASLVVWGRVDSVYEVNLEIVNKSISEGNLAPTLFDTVAIRLNEPDRLRFMTYYMLSQIFMLAGNFGEAKNILTEAIAFADQKDLNDTYPKDISRGYFILGCLNDEYCINGLTNRNTILAIKYYTIAWNLDKENYQAASNLAFLDEWTGNEIKALAIYEEFIHASVKAGVVKSSMKPIVIQTYFNLISLNEYQSNLQAAEASLKDLVAIFGYEPAYNYCLILGDLDCALQMNKHLHNQDLPH